jgi:hypothetical protein
VCPDAVRSYHISSRDRCRYLSAVIALLRLIRHAVLLRVQMGEKSVAWFFDSISRLLGDLCTLTQVIFEFAAQERHSATVHFIATELAVRNA